MRPTVLISVFAATITIGLPGCSAYRPGGGMMSRDVFTYPSTSDLPQTVMLKDVRTGATLWTYEVPVGRQLVVRFYDNANPDDARMPDMMKWEEIKLGHGGGDLTNSIAVPDKYSRRLDVELRARPEVQAAATPGG